MKIKIRPAYLIYSFAFVVLDIFGQIYRRAVYTHKLADFAGIADYYTNILACPAMVFLYLGFSPRMSKNEGIWKIGTCVGVLIVYEFLQPLLGMVFDWRDLVATFVGGGLTLGIYLATKWHNSPIDKARHLQ